MEGTFVKIDRKILKWEWFDDPYMFKLFVYLLLKANHKDGSWKGMEVKRGELVTGRKKLASELRFTEMQIRNQLTKLKTTNEITTKTTSKFTIITICKYDFYQSNNYKSNQQNNQQFIQQTTNNKPTNNQQTTTNKNDNNDKNVKNDKNEYSALSFLKNSNFNREPNIPNFEDVHRVFVQNGGTKEMAKTFFEKNEGVNWFFKGSPITNFSSMVPSYVETWKKNERNRRVVNNGFNEVPDDIDYNNLKL